MLVEVYKRLRNSIVAFVPRFAADAGKAQQFPPIFGTGFVVHQAGIIATNDHVLRAIGTLPRPETFRGIPADVLMLIQTDAGMAQMHFEIDAFAALSAFDPGGPAYYGPQIPDLGFVHIKVSDLLPVTLKSDGSLYTEGEEVATAGFPMGTDHLRAPGWLHQLSPTLQAGIISAVHPFPCSTPHGFTINVMTQGGASGSPVFSSQSGEVLGAVYAGLYDYDVEANETKARVPTNYTYAVPAHYIAYSIPRVLQDEVVKSAIAESKSIHDFAKEAHATNALTGERLKSPRLPW
jgi:Trypsin-like peptidase domain